MRVSNHSQRTTCQRLLSVASALVFLTALGGQTTAVAQESAPATSDSSQPDGEAATAPGEPAEEEKLRPTLELGNFKINDLRPTRNETAKLTFSMHLAFSKKLTQQQVEQLESWKHRLRDQVITAVRITYIKDFQEPDLSRLRRNILVRVNRLFKQKLAEEVLLSEYLFRTH